MPCRLVFPNRRVRNNVALRCTTLTLRLAWDESPMSHHSQRRSITSQQLIRSNDAAYFFYLISKSDDFTQCKIVAFRIYSFYSFFITSGKPHTICTISRKQSTICNGFSYTYQFFRYQARQHITCRLPLCPLPRGRAWTESRRVSVPASRPQSY